MVKKKKKVIKHSGTVMDMNLDNVLTNSQQDVLNKIKRINELNTNVFKDEYKSD